ncbi:MAG: hypothetical protein DCC75_09445 [Proteobacteria bacterium]|nr:MAG: hypothetical protein DCC75_09445 [Pseudomonadota bacterium]
MARCSNGAAGAILPFIALALICIIALVALVIDISSLFVNRNQIQNIAENAGIAALEEFVKEPITNANCTGRLQASLSKATSITSSNHLLALPSQPLNSICLGSTGDSGCISSNPNIQGVLTPGRWWFEPDCSVTPCRYPSCSPLNVSPFAPCFVPVDPCQDLDSVPGLDIVNAFKLELTTNSQSKIKAIFAKVIGFEFFHVAANAIAAIVPRHFIFALDVTPSVTGETHLRRAPNRSDYAFRLAAPASCGFGSANPCPMTGTSEPVSPSCTFASVSERDYYYALPDLRGTDTSPTAHFKDDYRCYTLSYEVASGSQISETYLIDTRSPANPQPLTNILEAMHLALETVRERKAPGDKIGFLGFDDRILAARSIPLHEPRDDNQHFQALFNLTDVNHPNFRERSISQIAEGKTKGLLFPQFDRYTDLRDPVEQALTMLNSNGATYAQRSVIMFSDFMANCADLHPNYIGMIGLQENPQAECRHHWTHFHYGMLRPAQWVRTFYKRSGVIFNAFVIGDESGPNHRLIRRVDQDGQASCMREDDARRGNFRYSSGLSPQYNWTAFANGTMAYNYMTFSNTAWD